MHEHTIQVEKYCRTPVPESHVLSFSPRKSVESDDGRPDPPARVGEVLSTDPWTILYNPATRHRHLDIGSMIMTGEAGGGKTIKS